MRVLSSHEDKQVYGQNDAFHFYASNAAEWKCSEDLEELIKYMRKISKDRFGNKFHFWVFYVPAPVDVSYKIERYFPQYEGAVFLGEYK